MSAHPTSTPNGNAVSEKRQKLEKLLNGAFFVPKEVATEWCQVLGLSMEELQMELVMIASQFAVVPTSGFRVGAVGIAPSGNIYLGFNVELLNFPLNYSVHAEQCLIANVARHRKDDGLATLAVNYPPCGHCRQFLKETHLQEKLIIRIRGRQPITLASMLPEAFEPSDLGQQSKMLCVSDLAPEIDDKGTEWKTLTVAALAAIATAWGPYTKSPSAVAIELQNGQICTGVYLESCAYNPSLPPLQACLCEVAMQRKSMSIVDWNSVKRVLLLEKQGAMISHEANSRNMAHTLCPHATFEHVLYH